MKTRRITFEWDCETCNDDEEVLDHNAGDLTYVHRASLETPNPGEHFEVVLVRNVCEYIDGEWDGLVDRSWAYIKDGQLPDFFDDGSEVPRRFRSEWVRQAGKA